jgi:hypothetical protein
LYGVGKAKVAMVMTAIATSTMPQTPAIQRKIPKRRGAGFPAWS